MLLIEPTVLKLQIDNYFEQIKLNKGFTRGVIFYDEEYPTITGLALFLGFSSVSYFKRYLERPEYEEIIKYGLLRVENRYEKLLQEGSKNAVAGLKKVGEWGDNPEIVQQVNVMQSQNNTSVDLQERIEAIKKMRENEGA